MFHLLLRYSAKNSCKNTNYLAAATCVKNILSPVNGNTSNSNRRHFLFSSTNRYQFDVFSTEKQRRINLSAFNCENSHQSFGISNNSCTKTYSRAFHCTSVNFEESIKNKFSEEQKPGRKYLGRSLETDFEEDDFIDDFENM